MVEFIFLIVLFLSNIIQTITGFAGTILAMPPSIYLIGFDNAKVVLNTLAMISCSIIAISNYKAINRKEVIKIITFMTIGIFIGTKTISLITSEDLLLKIYGIIIVLVAVKNILVKKELNIPNITLIIILLLSGVVHGMFVSGGALLVVYAVVTLKDKNEFRATLSIVWVVLNAIVFITQINDGLVTSLSIHYILMSIIPLFLAIYIGGKIANKIDQKLFLNISYLLLIISGISLLF